MKKAKYIVLEGSEGTGKGTQTRILVDSLRNQGFKVLETKEPGTPLSPVTMELRKMYLDAKYQVLNDGAKTLYDDMILILAKPEFQDDIIPVARKMIEESLAQIKENKELTIFARELISQAIRAIHIQKIIIPATETYDYIIQDRGIMSGLVYGVSCGVDYQFIANLSNSGINSYNGLDIYSIYDQIILFQGNVAAGLSRAKSAKQEFEAGDAMENKGVSFLSDVAKKFVEFAPKFNKVSTIEIDGKSIQEVTQEMMAQLD
jgi:thymidylate kinase